MGIQMKNNKVEHELGPIEYSGLTSDGSMVMGVAPYIPTIIEIVPDPILSWKIPNNMTFEEATTIPVPYSMVNIYFRLNLTILLIKPIVSLVCFYYRHIIC